MENGRDYSEFGDVCPCGNTLEKVLFSVIG